jgi:two-component system, NarL family, response regulator LiaR
MNVLVVDDHELFREGLVSLLKADDYFKVVGQAGSVHEAINLARKVRPDLILMDFSLPDGDGAEASAVILSEQPDCNIVFLTMYDADDKLFAAIRSGAKGYLLKNVPVARLVSSLKSIEKGEAAISGTMTMRILEQFSVQPNGKTDGEHTLLGNLSQREVEIFREMTLGESNSEIATKLFLSINTVKHHIHNIYTKLNLENRRAAVQYAQRIGLVKPNK